MNLIFWAEDTGVACLQSATKCIFHFSIFEKDSGGRKDNKRFNIGTSPLRLLLVFEVTVNRLIKFFHS